MKIIYKYQLELTEVQKIVTYDYAEFLCAKLQDGIITVWAQVDPTNEKATYDVNILGTGQPSEVDSDNHTYLDTIMLDGFVWHIWISDYSENI